MPQISEAERNGWPNEFTHRGIDAIRSFFGHRLNQVAFPGTGYGSIVSPVTIISSNTASPVDTERANRPSRATWAISPNATTTSWGSRPIISPTSPESATFTFSSTTFLPVAVPLLSESYCTARSCHTAGTRRGTATLTSPAFGTTSLRTRSLGYSLLS